MSAPINRRLKALEAVHGAHDGRSFHPDLSDWPKECLELLVATAEDPRGVTVAYSAIPHEQRDELDQFVEDATLQRIAWENAGRPENPKRGYVTDATGRRMTWDGNPVTDCEVTRHR